MILHCSYCHLLIQEMDVRIDKGFLLAIMELFNNENMRGTEVWPKVFFCVIMLC